MLRARVWWLPIVVVVFLLGLQAIPYGHDHADPPVLVEPDWDSLQTQELVARACYDCHSNRTVWPWYASIAPLSWLIQRDVNEGRKVLNFSEWDRPQKGAQKLVRAVRKGEMPPWYYAAFRFRAPLSRAELEMLIRGLEATSPGQR